MKRRLPLICAPMFLISGPRLVEACTRAGIAAIYPALNARTLEDLRAVLESLTRGRDEADAPFGVNLILHASNARREEELRLCEEFRVPVVVTGLASPDSVVERVHAYGGRVFHDVATVAQARKAAACGVDGLILVCAGAGGHTGTLSPFAFVPAVRAFFSGEIAVAGAITEGAAVLAVQALGADYAYAGTLFLGAPEALTPPLYRQMVMECSAADLVVTSIVTGAPASALRPSLEASGLTDARSLSVENKASWREVWSAGQGIENLHRPERVLEIVDRIEREYRAARRRLSTGLAAPLGREIERD